MKKNENMTACNGRTKEVLTFRLAITDWHEDHLTVPIIERPDPMEGAVKAPPSKDNNSRDGKENDLCGLSA